MRKLKIVNKKKFKKGLFFLSIGFLIILFVLLTPSYSNTKINYKIKSISKGDTLWSIAENEIQANRYFENADIRKVIYEIKSINQLQDSNLSEGVEIKIPTY